MRAYARACVPVVGLLALVAWTYGRSLTHFFHGIDDASVLAAARDGTNATPQFRPVFEAWNRLCFDLFGPAPLAWRTLGLALHGASALLLAALVRLLGASRGAAWVAGAAFATFYSGHEAPLWISANCGLLSVFFALVCALAFAVHLVGGRAWALLLALAAALLSTGSKQDCVLLAPLLVGIEVSLRGWRRLLEPRSLARYALFATVAAAWLAAAWRPELWAEAPTVGAYELDGGSMLELVGHLGLLLSVVRVEASPSSLPALAAGWALIAGCLALVRFSPQRRALVATGLAVSLVAILPVLPGHVGIAGTRYAYPAGIGIALIAAAAFEEAWERAAAFSTVRALRAGLALGLAAWLALQSLSIRSIEAWRFAPSCARFAALIGSTRALGDTLAAGRRAAVVAPLVWNVRDYTNGVAVLGGGELRVAGVEWLGWSDELAPALAAGGPFDRGTGRTLTSDDGGALVPLEPGAELPLEAWKHRVDAYAPGSPAGRVPVVELERAR